MLDNTSHVTLVVVKIKMKIGLTISIMKPCKSVKTDPESYHGLTLLPVIYKLFEKLTLKRLKMFVNANKNVFPDSFQ